MPVDRTLDEFNAYVEQLEELAWHLVGHTEVYETLMEDPSMTRHAYVEALERLVFKNSGRAN